MVPDYESGKFRGSAQGRTAAVSFLWWPYAYLRINQKQRRLLVLPGYCVLGYWSKPYCTPLHRGR